MRLYAKLAVMLTVSIGAQLLILQHGWEICFGIRCSIAELTRDEPTYERLLAEASEHQCAMPVHSHGYAAADINCKSFEPAATNTTEPGAALALAEARPGGAVRQ